jgi:heat-inducible transcriptional repressor
MVKTLNERQGKILNCIVGEYIDSKAPVSSKLLTKKYGFKIKPSTMRLEFQRLTDFGYLAQPHTSAGRVPTDKGYRFYVDNLHPKSGSRELSPLGREMDDSFRFFQQLTQRIAEMTSNLAMTYFPEEDVFFKEGWDKIFKEPEFEDTDLTQKFTEMVEDMEKNMEEFIGSDFPQVFIGKEVKSLASGGKEFSVIISKIHVSNKKDGLLALLGPKRMNYDKNVDIINSLNKTCQTKKK